MAHTHLTDEQDAAVRAVRERESVGRARCGRCGRSRPYAQTAIIRGNAAGNYRRAGRAVDRRVCVDCTAARLDYVQDPATHAHLNEHSHRWEQAARAFRIPILPGTPLDRMAGRVEPHPDQPKED